MSLVTFVAAGDNHGDKADPEALGALWEFCRDFRPQLRIHLGDCFDLRPLRKSANLAEQREHLRPDLDAGISFLRKFAPDVWLWGNHEGRLDDQIEGATDPNWADHLQGIKDELRREARRAGCKKILPYHAELGVYEIANRIALAHGYAHGKDAVAQQGQFFAQRGGGFICGHIHRLEMVSLQKWQGGAAYSAGCLCDKTVMGYSSKRLGTARWGTGWAAGWVDTASGDWKVNLIHKIGKSGKWVWPTAIKVHTPGK